MRPWAGPVVRAGLCAALSGGLLLPQAEVPQEVLLLTRIRRKMAENLGRIPDYTCVETIERSTRANRAPRFQLRDTVRLEVAHVGGKELYSAPGAQKFEEREISELVGGGMTASGDFASHARSVFSNSVPSFTYKGEEEIEGRRTVRYDYYLPINFSGYRLRYGRQAAIVASPGSFWADPQSLEVVRLEVRAEQIPPSIAVLSAVTRIDYDRVRIGASEVLLPQRAELLMSDFWGGQSLNRTLFTDCRQYVSESVVMFVESEVTYGPPAKKKK